MIDLLSLNAPFKMGRFPLRGKGIVSLESKVRGLFSNNEIGVWYDPSDLSTMFQDAAGTLPVTGDGQPVGKILDKSGRGNHATQATTTARPLYKTDGTYHWLQFDGVDDSLSTADALDHASNYSVFIGVRNQTSSWPAAMLSVRGPSSDTEGLVVALISGPQNNELIPRAYSTASIPLQTLNVGAKHVISVSKDQANHIRSRAIDRAAVSDNSVFATTPAAPSNVALRVGLNLNTQFFNGNIYSLIVRGALSTAAEITAAETWVNGKTGAY